MVGCMRNNKCYFIDIDGCIFFHYDGLYNILTNNHILLDGVKELFIKIRENGDYIVLTTARPESMRSLTINQITSCGLWFDQLVMGLPVGPRVVINDTKPNGMMTAIAINVKRNGGLLEVEV